MDVWIYTTPIPENAAREARMAEEAGFAGLSFVDTQNVFGDYYVALTLASEATDRLLIGTTVTNPVTRHPAVAASAFATLQRLSGGRVVLGLGRGDSALAHIGHAPASVRLTEAYLRSLQRYLAGEEVPFSEVAVEGVAPVAALGLAGAPDASRLEWLDPATPKVPVEVAASGPRMLEVAGRHADRALLGVGADPERVTWAAGIVRSAAAEAGREVKLGAFVNMVVGDDAEQAARVGGTTLASMARFSVLHDRVAGPHSEEAKRALSAISEAWDMRKHGFAAQQEIVPDDFKQSFGIFGPPAYCIERLQALAELGIERVVVCGPTMECSLEERATAARRLADEVLPYV